MIRNSVFFFAALGLFAIAGFWPSYLSRVHQEGNLHVHLHGAAMALWGVMLITQAYLIRTDYRTLHHLIGKFSYVLAPVLVLATLSLMHFRLREAGNAPPAELLYFLYVQFSLLLQFVICYGLAMINRHTPSVHAGYMVCTALTVVDPIFARLLFNYLHVVPPLLQIITYAFIDLILLWLIVWGRRQPRPVKLFPVVLLIFAATQIPTFFITNTEAWRAIALWYGALPIP